MYLALVFEISYRGRKIQKSVATKGVVGSFSPNPFIGTLICKDHQALAVDPIPRRFVWMGESEADRGRSKPASHPTGRRTARPGGGSNQLGIRWVRGKAMLGFSICPIS
jgi:hypothetical protein